MFHPPSLLEGPGAGTTGAPGSSLGAAEQHYHAHLHQLHRTSYTGNGGAEVLGGGSVAPSLSTSNNNSYAGAPSVHHLGTPGLPDAGGDSDDGCEASDTPHRSAGPASGTSSLFHLHHHHHYAPVPSSPGLPGPVRKVFSTGELLGLFAVSFSYAFCFNTINSIVIPKEVERLLPSRQSMWVGMIMGAGAVSQLATPIVGAWSDRAGSRTPFLIYGTFLTILGIVFFLFVGSISDVLMLFIAHVVTTIGLSVQYSMVTALLNDHVTEEQQGRASGCMAILAILGSGAGYAMFATSMPLYYSFCSYILATVMCLGICVMFIPTASDVAAGLGAAPGGSSGATAPGVVGVGASGHALGNGGNSGATSGGSLQTGGSPTLAIHVGSAPGSGGGGGGASTSSIGIAGAGGVSAGIGGLQGGGSSSSLIATSAGTSSGILSSSATTGGGGGGKAATRRGPALSPATSRLGACLENIAHALSMPSPTRFPDFFYACLGRGLFNTGLAGQVYLVYYLRDVLAADNPVQITSMVAVMALVGGVVGALPSGIISDRVGKKPVIYGSVAVCVVSVVLFMAAQGMQQMQAVGFIYGVGNVAYLSVDYALGVQSLPKKPASSDTDEKRLVPIDAAKDLGVFAMSATAGQLFGQVVYGALLDQFGTLTSTGTQYSRGGFIVVYAVAALSFIGSGISTAFVRGVK